MDTELVSDVTRSLASEDFDAVAARLPEVQESIAQALSAAPDDATREHILSDVLALHRRWLSLTRSLRAQAADQLCGLTAEQGYAGHLEPPGHIVQSIG